LSTPSIALFNLYTLEKEVRKLSARLYEARRRHEKRNKTHSYNTTFPHSQLPGIGSGCNRSLKRCS
jgi:hypothetical protein